MNVRLSQPRVFLGSSVEGLEIARAIQSNLNNVYVQLWEQGAFKVSRNYLDDLIQEANSADFAIFILSPDDVTKSRLVEETSPRDNVVFESGLFMGILGRERVFLVAPRKLQLKKD